MNRRATVTCRLLAQRCGNSTFSPSMSILRSGSAFSDGCWKARGGSACIHCIASGAARADIWVAAFRVSTIDARLSIASMIDVAILRVAIHVLVYLHPSVVSGFGNFGISGIMQAGRASFAGAARQDTQQPIRPIAVRAYLIHTFHAQLPCHVCRLIVKP